MGPTKTCAHCGLAVRSSGTSVQVHGQELVFCCSGCAFVYELAGGGESGGSAESWFLIMLAFSAVISGFIMSFSLVFYFNPDLPGSVRDLLHYILLALATPVIFGVGYSYLKTAAREAVRGELSMASLIALGTVTAYFYSAYLTFRHAEHVYFDTATMVIVLVTVGRFMQARARARAASAMRTFAAQTPQHARRVRGTHEQMIAADEIQPGDLIRVLPAEKIAVDGRVREGRTTVDGSLLTGESLPVTRGPGDLVFQGTINLDGTIVFKATQVGTGTLQAQIERLLADAVGARMPLQALVDRVSAGFVIATVTLAAGVALFYTMHQRPTDGFLNALSVLVVACPCALGIATPIAAFMALQRAARGGVLIRYPEVLEKMARIDTVVFDKTGTVTEGRLCVTEVRISSRSGISPEHLLRIAASLENCSEHHAARAVVAEYKTRSSDLLPVENFVNRPGEGVEGDLPTSSLPAPQRTSVHLGTLISLLGKGMQLPADLEALGADTEFETRVYIGWDGCVRGVIRLGDQLRPGAVEVVQQCKRQHLDVRLLSGDRKENTERVARALGISSWAGERLPWQKVEYVEDLQAAGHRVAMVGDGVNDAPALAKAFVGLAHEGTDLSKEAADVHILGGDLARVPWSLTLACQTFHRIRQNLFWAFFYNVIAMGLAAAGLLKPIMAATAMLLSSFMVTANSMRLGKSTAVPWMGARDRPSTVHTGLTGAFGSPVSDSAGGETAPVGQASSAS